MTNKRHCKPELRNYSDFSEGVVLEIIQSSVFFQSKTEPVSLCWFLEEKKKKKFMDSKKTLAAILIQITNSSKISS